MLLNQNQASKQLGCSRQYINRLKNEKPRPEYFIDLKDGVAIDSEHPSWKNKVKLKKLKEAPKVDESQKKLMQFVEATRSVLIAEFGEEEAERVQGLIIEELRK